MIDRKSLSGNRYRAGSRAARVCRNRISYRSAAVSVSAGRDSDKILISCRRPVTAALRRYRNSAASARDAEIEPVVLRLQRARVTDADRLGHADVGDPERGVVVAARVQAVEAGCEAAVVLDGRVSHAMLLEIFTQEGAGTLIRAG